MEAALQSPATRSPAETANSEPLSPDVSPGSDRRFSYQPALDGLRALAVSAVLLFHQGFPWAGGGFLGVDIFFVLSGYLITGLLVEEWRANGRVSLTAFWARRARRLLPALYLFMLGIVVYTILFVAPQDLGKLRAAAFTTLAGVGNWRTLDISDVPDFTPLNHTWSLAIEQQWYVVWPFIVIGLLSLWRGSLKLLLGATVVLALLSALLMAWLYNPGSGAVRIYYGTDTRAQVLLVGGALAVLFAQYGAIRNGRGRFALQVASLACASAIVWACVRARHGTAPLSQGGYLLFALAVAVVIAAVSQSKSGPLARFLSLPPLRGLGLISYGVYLWHVPVYGALSIERTSLNGYALFAARAYLTLMLAIISYNLIETPLRRGALRRWRFSWTLAPAGAVCLAGLIFVVTLGPL